ncbi:MAG: Endonuclease/exonuclease/phosphatase [Geminicoccaceae bacterium]|nr:Endonuclease/exonuclease/phosphatase [Geminicoccaceae bacterium]
MTLRLLSYNIRYGGTGREDSIAAVIRSCSPDIVVLQEATDPAIVERIAERSDLPHWGSRVGHSTGFLSRLPVAHHAWHSPLGARHPFLEVVLEGRPVRVFGLHLSAWFSKWSERRRAREIRLLLDGIREHQGGFHVIAGDFNALAPGERLQVAQMPAWIRAMVWVSGRDIARDTIQVMLDEHYADVWRRLHPGVDGYTFPTWSPHVRLDYIFTPERYMERIQMCTVVTAPPDAASASDHYPLFAEVSPE